MDIENLISRVRAAQNILGLDALEEIHDSVMDEATRAVFTEGEFYLAWQAAQILDAD